MRRIMASLDIGNKFVKLVVGEMVKNKINILAVSEVPTKGIRKNKIINEEEVKQVVASVIKDAEDKLNLPINKLIMVVPSNEVEFTIGEAKINVISEDKVITGQDVVKVVQESAHNIVQDNMELVSIIPISFKLDNNNLTKNPKKMISNTLGVRSVIITAPKNSIYPYIGILEQMNIDVLDIAFDSMGDYFTYRNKDDDKEIGAIINIGDAKTTVSIFNKGVLTNTALIDLGGSNIDNDIAFIYKIEKEQAYKLKMDFALAHSQNALDSETNTIKNKLGEEVKINQLEISKIVHSRLDEILKMAKKQINLLTKKEISYIIITGGVTESLDFKLTLTEIFGKNVTLGKINTLGVRNNKYASALGLIKWYNYYQQLKDRDYSIFNIEEQEEFSGVHKQTNISDNSVIGKVFGYFFDN